MKKLPIFPAPIISIFIFFLFQEGDSVTDIARYQPIVMMKKSSSQ
jgi:hypothetical protein